MSTTDHWYPDQIKAGEFAGKFNKETVGFLLSKENDLHCVPKDQLQIAEFGIWKGATSYQFAKYLDGQGTLHLFDYDDKVTDVSNNLANEGYENVKTWGSSYKYLDSYNWSLMKILRESDEPLFDYVYLDGAHTWAIDALTFFLCDKLLKTGGYMDFDDYKWKLGKSRMSPKYVPETALLYTEEQMQEKQVKLIVDILVKPNPQYREIVADKIFQKV